MLTLVIPVYRNEGSIHDLLNTVVNLYKQLNGKLVVIFVVDGSPDRCYELLRDLLPIQPFASKLVLLSKNFGSFSAIRAGLELSDTERYAVMAADLQEPPELVLEMDMALKSGFFDVVVGTRESRNDPFLNRIPAQFFWWIYRKYVIPEIPSGGVDVFGCNRAFRDTLLRLDEHHTSLIAQIFWLGFRRKFISYVRQPRQHGTSAWTLRKKINYLMDSVFAFTDLPIRLLIRIGGSATIVAGLLGLTVIIGRLMGMISVPGYAMTILTIVFLGSVNLLGLGIVGSYAWRTYENTKARPIVIPMSIHLFDQLN